MTQNLRWLAASVLCTVSVTLMIAVSISDLGHEARGWAILSALAGCVFLGWGLLVAERLKMERLAQIMADTMSRERGTTHIH